MSERICKSCGAVLQEDFIKKLLNCPSCGAKYDFAFFNDDSYLTDGYKCLSNKEYATAEDYFDRHLKKYPNSVSALRGKLLSNLKYQTLTDIRKTDYTVFDFDPSFYITNAPTQYKSYFDSLDSLSQANIKRKNLNTEITTLEHKHTEVDAVLKAEIKKLGDKNSKAVLFKMYFWLFVFLCMIGISINTKNVFAIVAVVISALLIVKALKSGNRSFERKRDLLTYKSGIIDIESELEKNKKLMDDLNNEVSKAIFLVKKFDSEIERKKFIL